ncbi:13437_t:CDS:2, partial [Dentiscutata heterogama]
LEMANHNVIESEMSIVKEPVVCYNRFEKPHKKLDGALAIPYVLDNIKDFENVEEEILSRTLPKQWVKIELGHICYQLSNTSKADQYDLKADGAIIAFVTEAKYKKNIHLCVYQEYKDDKANKRIRDLLNFIFPNGSPKGKRFLIKSSLDINSKTFLPEQIISQVFIKEHINIWIEIEDIEIKFDDLFD